MTSEASRQKAPWDRLPGESSKAYVAFITYRDLGPYRSIRKAIEKQGLSVKARLRTWLGWSSKYHWVERASAWSDHVSRLELDATERAIIAAAEREAAQREGLDTSYDAKQWECLQELDRILSKTGRGKRRR